MSCFVYKYIYIIHVIKNMGKKPQKKPREIYAKYLRSLTRIGKVQAIHNIF